MKPLFRWVGSKARLAPRILEVLGPIEGRYVEPFCGGAAVFWAMTAPPKAVWLNDLNVRIIDTYLAVRDVWEDLANELVMCRRGQLQQGFAEFYKTLKTSENVGMGALVGRAARFLALNQTGFNGLWRTNKSGGYNVPIGKNSRGEYYEIVVPPLESYSLTLRECRTVISHRDFRKMSLLKGDVVYCDPPFAEQFSSYQPAGFGRKDHEDLREWCEEGARQGARVVLSGSDARETLDIYGEPAMVLSRANTVGVGRRGRVNEVLYVYDRSGCRLPAAGKMPKSRAASREPH